MITDTVDYQSVPIGLREMIVSSFPADLSEENLSDLRTIVDMHAKGYYHSSIARVTHLPEDVVDGFVNWYSRRLREELARDSRQSLS